MIAGVRESNDEINNQRFTEIFGRNIQYAGGLLILDIDQQDRQSVWPEQLAVRVARCYYELGMTQQEIARSVGIGRARVIRLLAEARDKGIVTIHINSPLLENVQLAEELAGRFGLVSADVCLSNTSDENLLADQIAIAAGEFVLRMIEDNMTIGLGWGVSLKALARRIDRSSTTGVSVVSLLGSLTQRSSIDRFEASTELAAKLGAECFYLPAPIVCDSQRSRDLLVDQFLFRQIFDRALSADLALVSIGGLNSATIRQAGLVDDDEYNSANRHGAVGNFLGLYIDKNAEAIDHPINERIVGVSGEDFQRIPRRVMVSAGESKVKALFAVLDKGLLTDVVTDHSTAQALLNFNK